MRIRSDHFFFPCLCFLCLVFFSNRFFGLEAAFFPPADCNSSRYASSESSRAFHMFRDSFDPVRHFVQLFRFRVAKVFPAFPPTTISPHSARILICFETAGRLMAKLWATAFSVSARPANKLNIARRVGYLLLLTHLFACSFSLSANALILVH